MPEVHRTSGISTWQYCNALTMKLAPPSDDDRNYYTLGLVWARDVASVTSRANIPRCVLPTRWLILKRSPESVSWNKKYSHLLKIQACDYHLRISWIIFHSFRSVPGIFQVLILYPLNVFLGVLFKKNISKGESNNWLLLVCYVVQDTICTIMSASSSQSLRLFCHSCSSVLMFCSIVN